MAAADLLVPPERQLVGELVRRLPPVVQLRGREYLAEGRVHVHHRARDLVTAFVQGTRCYEVHVHVGGSRAHGACSCIAFEREGVCKHVAAVGLALSGGDATPSFAAEEPLPDVLRRVYSSSVFLSRLSLHAGVALRTETDRWSPLHDWWRRSQGARSAAVTELRRLVLAHAPEIARDVDALAAWTPAAAPLPGTVYGDLYANLAEIYAARRERIEVRGCAPGPLDGRRHPGFELSYDARRGFFEARERLSPLLTTRLRLAFSLPLPTRTEPSFADGALDPYSPATDAWELFALREILLALHARTDAAALHLEEELGRPVWDHVLDQLATTNASASRTAEPREWAFCLWPTYYRGGDYKVVAYARRARADGRAAKWKKESFEALYTEETTELEREIARVAIVSQERTADARFTVGTPQGHEVLRLLAGHPRVLMPTSNKPNPDAEPSAQILVGDVTMKVDRAPNGVLAPRFLVDGTELSPAMFEGPAGAPFRRIARGALIGSAFVPPALRPWLAAAERLGTALAFPPEAVSKLATTTQPLVAAGVAELPRAVLGDELAYEPRPALRVEWRREGAAVIAVLVEVHPGAPLVAAGKGPELFTFEHRGKRVFVERDRDRELAVAKEARGKIDAPLAWNDELGRTDTLEEALALADWLDRNPLGLAIEVAVGRRPQLAAFADATRALEVQREGDWLVLDGKLDVKGAKLTLGDLLEAARLARRFVKAEDGLFLELSKEALEKLRPVAIAAELGEAGGGRGGGGEGRGEEGAGGEGGSGGPRGPVRVHHAFGAILAEARSIFGSVRGANLDEYARRFETRDTRLRVANLDKGKLRPYQREGVAWMLRLASWAPGCVLADDMGLGKTVQTAALLKARAELGPQLIVAPASVSSNWMSELARFVPSLAVRWFNDDRTVAPSELGPGDVLVVSYGLLQRSGASFADARWATLVVDEAQYVKNVTAQRTDAIRALGRDFTIALTGTPLENHLGELYSIMDIVFPGLLGTEATFRERFRRPIEGQRDPARLEVLGRLLGPFLLRRTRAAVLDDLPAREEITEYVDLSPAEAKRYVALRKVCEDQFKKRKKGETSAQLRIALFAALTRLRQLACDPALVDPSFTGTSTKVARVVELAAELAQENNHALVFSQFTQFLDRMKPALEAAGLRVAYLAGDTPTNKRRAIVEAFQAGEYDVFLVSLLAGGTGLNLTKASYVIHTDPWWNPAAEEQATSRAHRMGQTEPVTVYRLVARGTIEEAVLAMHASKRELAASVLEGKASARAISSQELVELIRFGG